jgi:hypothetical protein
MLGWSAGAEASPDVLAIVADMEAAYATVRDYTARFTKHERINDQLRNPEEILLKFREPGQIYMRWTRGDAVGREILFVKGRDQDRALVHQPGLLTSLLTIVVAPDSPKVLQDSRYPITDVGVGRLIKLLAANTRRAVARGELAASELSPIGAPGSASGGAGRRVELITPRASPDYFCHRAVVAIDGLTRLPVAVELFDANGALFGSYTYRDLVLNPGLADLDFDSANAAYRLSGLRVPY